MRDLTFEDNTDRQHGRYDFSYTTDSLDYDGYIIEAPSSSRMNDEVEWGVNMPDDWEDAEKKLLDAFNRWKYNGL